MLLKLLLEVDVDGRLWAGRRTLQKDLFRRNRPAPCEFGQVAGFTHEASQTRIEIHQENPCFGLFGLSPLGAYLNRSGDVKFRKSDSLGCYGNGRTCPPKIEMGCPVHLVQARQRLI